MQNTAKQTTLVHSGVATIWYERRGTDFRENNLGWNQQNDAKKQRVHN